MTPASPSARAGTAARRARRPLRAPRRWRLLHSERVVRSPWLTVERNAYRVPGGRRIDDYYVITRDAFVLVVAVRNGRVILIRQYRPATNRAYWCLPAGYVDSGEAVAAAARRELQEETGLVAGRARVIARLDLLPAYLRSRAYVVLCERVAGRARVRRGVELITGVAWVTWRDVVARIRRGALREMQAVCALLFAREWLRP